MEHQTRRWYVIHTKPRQKTLAADNLQRQSFEIHLPRLEQIRRDRGKWRRSIEPLFPRYLFIRLALGRDNTAPIRSTRGLTRLVGFTGRPAPVPEAFIDTLSACGAATGLHHPEARFEPGRAVTIVGGPLQGLQAIFRHTMGRHARSFWCTCWGRPKVSGSQKMTCGRRISPEGTAYDTAIPPPAVIIRYQAPELVWMRSLLQTILGGHLSQRRPGLANISALQAAHRPAAPPKRRTSCRSSVVRPLPATPSMTSTLPPASVRSCNSSSRSIREGSAK
ncbi:MAG: transcriptional activator RfaH [Gammaproteobacteria bacterium]|jgi:transcriptional antiterminator RfaH